MSRKEPARPHPKPTLPRNYVKSWRVHRGYSQETLAEMVGMTHASLSRIERGKQNFDAQFLALAAEALQCSVPDLLIRDPSDPEGIWSIWDQAKPVQRAQIVDLSRVVIKRNGTDG